MKTKSIKSLVIILAAIFIGTLLYFFVPKAFNSKKSFMIEAEQKEESQPSILTEENVRPDELEIKEKSGIEILQETKKEVSEKIIEKEKTKKNDTPVELSLSIKNNLVSWGFEVPDKERTVDSIIIHSSYDALGDDPYDVDGLVAEYKLYGVSAHYLIDRKGVVYRLVADENVAYHAGQSKTPDGRTGVNYFSLGIEIMNTKEDKFTKKQYSALNNLLSELKKTYDIKYVLGHDDIAPNRKTDPWNFDWSEIGN